MEPKPARPLRQVAIADHLWEAFERLAEALGSSRDALVNEAMHLFARRHGYLPPALGDVPSRREVAEQVLGAADRLEEAMQAEVPAAPAADPASAPAGPGGARSLYLLTEAGDLVEVKGDRFVIGRGRHCDMVIDSTKVSREHAAIVSSGDGFLIEDLGSANGTWFQQKRIDRRRIADGDEFFICADRIRCVIR